MIKNINIFPDFQALTDAVVERFITIANQSVMARNFFFAALSGGSTPKPIYQALSAPVNQDRLPWQDIHLFWGDERHVPQEHPESNYRMVKENLLDFVAIPEINIHRVPTEMDPRLAAFYYEEKLRQYFEGAWPHFDLVLLGMGKDGHTASLFPNSPGLNEEHRWFIANRLPNATGWRLTLTKNAINAARHILILVQGSSKANMLFEVLCGDINPYEKPVQMIAPMDGHLDWMVDDEAASQLPEDYVSIQA